AGMIIAGHLFSAKESYIYMRGEYRRIQKTCQEALDNARPAGFLGENILGIEGFNYDITIIAGAGAYICGENSALLNSIEGRTGQPRV
ncbi:NADH-quinone oxidoreductase subunit F, partial [Enterococcus faecalis]|nr:NADH-quinone oxidoreductase subunit F [Enterococcus faecalis]